jgi:L-fuconolactonase
MRIDTHQHFWQYMPSRDTWITDDMKVIQRDFLPEDAEPLLTWNDFEGCVAVQADQSHAETHFLAELAVLNAQIKGVVGWTDLRAPDVDEWLDYFKAFPSIKGFRHIVQAEPDGFMLDPAFMNGIKMLEYFGFTYDVLIFPHQLSEALQLVRAFPNQKFVLDHIAKPYIKKGEIDQWAKDMRLLATCENLSCKISGMVTETDWHSWKPEDFTPYMDVAFEAFGANRLMFGTDHPVCLLAGSFEQVVGIVDSYTNRLSEAEKHLFWHQNAVDFYGL